MKKKTTTDIEVTKVVAQRRLDTNPVSNKQQTRKQTKQTKQKKT